MCVESEIRGDVTIGETFSFFFFLITAIYVLPYGFVLRQNLYLFLNFFALTGARTVVHPKARIIADAGPIIIGEGNLIEEQALIINR